MWKSFWNFIVRFFEVSPAPANIKIVRRSVNVLNTVGAENPSLNPFLQAFGGARGGGKTLEHKRWVKREGEKPSKPAHLSRPRGIVVPKPR